jgi:hypothetical protein
VKKWRVLKNIQPTKLTTGSVGLVHWWMLGHSSSIQEQGILILSESKET